MSFQQRYAVIDAITATSASSNSSSSSPPMHSALLGRHLDDMRVVLQLYDESGLSMQLVDTFTTFASTRHDRKVSQPNHSGRRNRRQRGGRQLDESEDGADGEGGPDVDEKEEMMGAAGTTDDFLPSLPPSVRAELYVRFSACVDALRWCGFVRPAAGKRGADEMIKTRVQHDVDNRKLHSKKNRGVCHRPAE